jgi:hypothetical protein
MPATANVVPDSAAMTESFVRPDARCVPGFLCVDNRCQLTVEMLCDASQTHAKDLT